MSHRIQRGSATTPAAAVPTPSASSAAQPRPPAQAQASAGPGNLQPRSVRAQERVNHQLREGIRSIRQQGVTAAAAEAQVRQAMAAGAEPSRSSRSPLRVLMQREGHGNTALHYLAAYGTPGMSREIIRDPQSQNLNVNAPARWLASGTGKGATPLHLAVEHLNGEVLRDLLTVPDADVQRRYFNPDRFAELGSRGAATMSVVQVAEYLAAHPQGLSLSQRPDLVTTLAALVEHGALNGYAVNCGAFTAEVREAISAPAFGDHTRDAIVDAATGRPVPPGPLPAYASSAADAILPVEAGPAQETPPAHAAGPARPGPSSSPRRS